MTALIAVAAEKYACKLDWTVSGAATAPTDNPKSDGYQVKHTCGHKPSATAHTGTGVAQGTCVETLDSAGAALTDTTGANMGNYGICHVFRLYTTAAPAPVVNDTPLTASNIWMYLQTISKAQWGVAIADIGLVIKGNAAPAATDVSVSDYKVVFNPLNTAVTALAADGNLEVTWLQPIQAASYTGLRRYSKDEKVKAYTINDSTAATRDACTGAACLLNASAAGAVAITGAAALATGAAAVAVASLAF